MFKRSKARKSLRGALDSAGDRFEIAGVIVNKRHSRYQRRSGDHLGESPPSQTLLARLGETIGAPVGLATAPLFHWPRPPLRHRGASHVPTRGGSRASHFNMLPCVSARSAPKEAMASDPFQYGDGGKANLAAGSNSDRGDGSFAPANSRHLYRTGRDPKPDRSSLGSECRFQDHPVQDRHLFLGEARKGLLVGGENRGASFAFRLPL